MPNSQLHQAAPHLLTLVQEVSNNVTSHGVPISELETTAAGTTKSRPVHKNIRSTMLQWIRIGQTVQKVSFPIIKPASQRTQPQFESEQAHVLEDSVSMPHNEISEANDPRGVRLVPLRQ